MSQTTELIVKLRQVGGEQLTQLASKLNYLGKQTTATSTNFKSLADELKKTQATSVQSINNLKGYATAWREIANSVDIASQEFRQATAEAAKLDAQVAKAQGRRGVGLRGAAQIAGTAAAGGIFGGVEGLLGGIGGGVIGGVQGAAIGAAIGGQVSAIRQQLSGLATYTAEIEKQRIALKLVVGDSNSYAEALSFIDQRSRALAIPQEQITRLFTQLSASVLGAGGNIRDAEIAFNGIAAGIRGTGGSLQDLEGALRATAQVFSKGKVSAEELRQQIGERLPGAFTLFAQSIGKTPQQLDKALEEGSVSLQDFIKFSEELFKRYGKNAEIISKGPQSAGDRLQTALSRLNESIGRLLAPIGAAFQSVFADIVNAIDRGARALARFMGMKFFDQGRINEITGDIKRLKEELKTVDVRGRAYRENLIKLKETELKTLEAMRPKGGVAAGQFPESRLPGITPDSGKQGARKAKEIVDRTAEELQLIKDINKYEREGLDLKAAFGKFQLAELEVELALERKLIGRNQAIEKLEEAETRLGKSIRASMSGIGDMVLKNEENARKLEEAIQDLEIRAEMRSEAEIKEIQRKRLINELEKEYGTLSADNLIRINAAFDKVGQKLTETQELTKSIVLTIGEGLGNALMSVFDKAQSLSEVMGNILKQVANLLLNFGIQAGLKGLFPNLFKSAYGNIMTENGPLPLKKYARGGITSGPVLSLAGEAGPEAIVPLPDGRSIPVTIKGGTATGNIIVNVDASGTSVQGDQGQGKALGAAIAAAVQSELIKQKKPGGLLY